MRAVEAIRFLARGERQKRAILSSAKLVLAASKETSIVDKLFRKAGLHEGEFLRLLQTVIDGRAINRERITTIAAAVAPLVRRARGPKISAASAAHEPSLRRMHAPGSAPGTLRVGSTVSIPTRELKPPGRNLTTATLSLGPPIAGSNGEGY